MLPTTTTTTKTILTTLLSLTLLTTSASATPVDAAAVQPRALLGGINVDLACKVQNGDQAWYAHRIGSGAGDWKCRRGDEWRDVNMNAACASQYARPEAYAVSGGGVFDWSCHI